MKRNKILYILFVVMTVVLLCAMCASVAFHYAQMICAMNHCGASAPPSAPPSVAFLVATPFLIGIAISAALSFVFYRKPKRMKN